MASTAPQVHCVSLACRVIHENFGKLPAVSLQQQSSEYTHPVQPASRPAAGRPHPLTHAHPSVSTHVQEVAEVLLRKGRQSFVELLRNTNSPTRASRQLHLSSSSNGAGSQQGPNLAASQLKQVLLVLIQHNCVITRLQPSEVMVTGVRPAVHLYEADLGQMLQLIRCGLRHKDRQPSRRKGTLLFEKCTERERERHRHTRCVCIVSGRAGQLPPYHLSDAAAQSTCSCSAVMFAACVCRPAVARALLQAAQVCAAHTRRVSSKRQPQVRGRCADCGGAVGTWAAQVCV